jgi:CRISPR-associated exonuclease Cas4
MNGLPLIAAALLLLALILLRAGRKKRAESGVPGQVIYEDNADAGTLFSRRYLIAGRPDYLAEEGGAVVPVEIKSGKAPRTPYESHIFQLMAYCLLVEEAYGEAPPYGLLRYDDRLFEIDYTPERRRALLLIVEDMRIAASDGEADRSHDEARRCAACSYRHVCDRALEG